MSIRNALINQAITQWTWFGEDEGRADKYVTPGGKTTTDKTKGKRKETVEPYSSRVADYWLAISNADYDRLVKAYAKEQGRLDGTIDLAWSAAFVSYCMQMAGAGTSFPYAPGHATWIVKSIANRQAGKLNAPLVGFKPGEIPLVAGDIIGKPREPGITYKNAVGKGWFIAHSDIVVDVDPAKRTALVIGGNVGQSVSRTKVSISADGKLDDDGGWIVHIQNNIVAGSAVASARPGKEVLVG
jgi:hypothetical protein